VHAFALVAESRLREDTLVGKLSTLLNPSVTCGSMRWNCHSYSCGWVNSAEREVEDVLT
jgi:hypothetical protein